MSLYAYPETNDNGYYLVYDKSVVSDEQAGKLEDILAACQEAGKQFVMDCGDGFYSCTFAFTAGVQVDGLEEDGITQKFVDYDEDAAVKTLQAFGKLIKKYKGTFVSLNVKNVASGLQAILAAQVLTVLGILRLTKKLSATTSALLSSRQLTLTAKTNSSSQCSVTNTSA